MLAFAKQLGVLEVNVVYNPYVRSYLEVQTRPAGDASQNLMVIPVELQYEKLFVIV